MAVNEAVSMDNENLTRVGPGTMMGELMRRYWLPALRSDELQTGGAPVRLMLLGEALLAFRSPSGEVGILDHQCAHRNASLFFGRNEPGGMRCVYHGWKFDLTGQCVDVPNNPARLDIKDKVKLKAYRAVERSGVVWVYMGEQLNPPSLPAFEFMDLDPDDLNIVFVQRECNFMQSLEGDIDTSHLGFLHVGNIEPDQLDPEDLMRHVVSNRVPELSVGDAPWGTQYCAQKSTNEGQHYLRYANFLFPFWTQVPQGEFETNIIARAWVPMDDTHTMSIAFGWKRRPPPFKTMANGEPLPGDKPAPQHANGSGWFERFRPIQNLANDYLIDRDAQITDRIYTGIENINIQDHAVTESMGAITDRTRERLTPSDLMIVRTRRRLLQAARELKEQGTLPPGLDDSSIYRDARSGELVVTTNDPWPQTYQRELKQALRAEHINSVQP